MHLIVEKQQQQQTTLQIASFLLSGRVFQGPERVPISHLFLQCAHQPSCLYLTKPVFSEDCSSGPFSALHLINMTVDEGLVGHLSVALPHLRSLALESCNVKPSGWAALATLHLNSLRLNLALVSYERVQELAVGLQRSMDIFLSQSSPKEGKLDKLAKHVTIARDVLGRTGMVSIKK